MLKQYKLGSKTKKEALIAAQPTPDSYIQVAALFKVIEQMRK